MPRTVTRVAPVARLSEAELPPLDPSGPRWPGRQVEVGGASVYVRDTPSSDPAAEPALCVHGLGGSATNWTDLAELLSARLAVEAIDLPGFGFAGPAPDRDYSVRAHARTVIGYLQQSGRGPVHLIGNSMGGAVAILVAGQRPDLVRTLTLISPAVPDVRLRVHPLRYDPRMAALVLPGLGVLAMRQAAGLPARTRVQATIALCFADPSRFPEHRLEQAIEDVEARSAMSWVNGAFLGSLRGLVRSQLAQGRRTWALMRTIAAPTLVIWGDTDRLVAPDLAAHVAAAIPGSRLLMLAGIGHTAMMEDPVTTARAVLALVEDAASAR